MFVIVIGFGDGTKKEVIIRAESLGYAYKKGENRAKAEGGFLLDVYALVVSI